MEEMAINKKYFSPSYNVFHEKHKAKFPIPSCIQLCFCDQFYLIQHEKKVLGLLAEPVQ